MKHEGATTNLGALNKALRENGLEHRPVMPANTGNRY